MIRWLRPLVLMAMVAAIVIPASAQRRRPEPAPAPALPPPPADVRVRSELTQSAAWIGDPLDFVVEIDTAPGVEIVAEDLMPEKLVVEGLELGASSSSSVSRADGWRTLRHAYRVVAWDTTPPKRIGDLTVRFRRPVTAATADGTAPAADVKVAGATLSMRSTLPDDGNATGARDHRAALPLPTWLGWVRPVGLGFIALGIAPVLLWVGTRIRRPRLSKPRPSSRSLHALLKSLFDELQIIDTSTADGRRRAYDRIDADVRAYLTQAEALPAAALTPDELRSRLATSKRLDAPAVCDILAECELARYAPADRLPDASALGGTVERLRTALRR
jgi:hypothetical protein